jgi:hypothetical protein
MICPDAVLDRWLGWTGLLGYAICLVLATKLNDVLETLSSTIATKEV